jgi:hypothetical protein
MTVRTGCFGADAVGPAPEIRHGIGGNGVGGGSSPQGRCPLRRHCRKISVRSLEPNEGIQGGCGGGMVLMSEYLHEQTSLTAGTIAHDDELATNLGHLRGGQYGNQDRQQSHRALCGSKMEKMKGKEGVWWTQRAGRDDC